MDIEQYKKFVTSISNEKNEKNDDDFILEIIKTKPGQYQFQPDILKYMKNGGHYDSQNERFYSDIMPTLINC